MIQLKPKRIFPLNCQTGRKLAGLHIVTFMTEICKARWPDMEETISSGRVEFGPVRIHPTSLEAGSSLRKPG